MTDFLSKISGQIAGPIVLGAFVPVVLFVVALALVVLPVTAYAQPLDDLVTRLKVFDDKATVAVVMTLAVFILSLVLYNLNIPIIRLYEGYPWQNSIVGGWLKDREKARFRDLTWLRQRIRQLRQDARLSGINFDDEAVVESQRVLARKLNDVYPALEGLVLPTDFGNVIRSFETYPLGRYGISLIQIWPRLQGVIPSTYAQGLEGAKTSVDFMVNCSFLSAVLAIALTVAGLRGRHPLNSGADGVWVAWVFVFLAFWRLFYLGAINRAAEWGIQVRAAFDLYRGALLAQLGYEIKPGTLAEERVMWETINYKLSFPDEALAPDLLYRKEPSFLEIQPNHVILAFERTLSSPSDRTMQVRIVITNTDPRKFDATEIIVNDDIPAGLVVIHNSVRLDGGNAVVLDFDPLRVRVGAVPAGATRTVSYQLKKAA